MTSTRWSDLAYHLFSLVILLAFGWCITLTVSVHQYSWSLLIWTAPVVKFLPSVLSSTTGKSSLRLPCLGAIAHVFVAGAVTVVFFAHYFYTFPNRGALFGVLFPSIHPFDHRIMADRPYPLEDLVFYFIAAASILSAYLWALASFGGLKPKCERPTRAAWCVYGAESIAACIAVFALAVFAKSHLNPVGNDPLPRYLMLQLVAIAVVVVLIRAFYRQVNACAAMMTLCVFIPLSYLYEVYLAIPGEWWKYEKAPMIGIFLDDAGTVPVECVSLWFIGVLLVIVTFEGLRCIQQE